MIKETFRRKLCAFRYYFFERKKEKDYYSTCCFDYYKCIFVHIPKCAGISVARALFGNNAGGHTSIMQYQRVFPERTLDEYFKFTFVRNPYSRLLSAFQYMQKGGRNEKDKKWAEKHMKFSSFEDFVLNGISRFEIINYLHFRPQVSFLIDDRGELKVDFIGRFETLEEDFNKIKNRVKPQAKLPHLNRSSTTTKDWKARYTPEMIEVVNDLYRFDFEVLGYPFL
ncbi:MAG: hypothetical protein D6794_10770 [Deltaproteobacteria bacterium]|nr:MAG: hypothetical protein D6794_10770 [Deltaproteobacteria bacterium]